MGTMETKAINAMKAIGTTVRGETMKSTKPTNVMGPGISNEKELLEAFGKHK
jgi:hypothetical protein